ncbi:hypothetical protein IFT79_10705 [Frigoribacterium sp. CFBP 8759]|uniref:hypothetical protein n=1 Tax=Frigoribacterium sp. CFBP 8759 TaxID=2775283 RepID=UPI00177B2D42|nr:hypothetical protein [Frigoribacterium sp. CFBP 8759]MBD8486085.1 hypothetical protein [Frigoribacterium sp. CFBP 8759]
MRDETGSPRDDSPELHGLSDEHKNKNEGADDCRDTLPSEVSQGPQGPLPEPNAHHRQDGSDTMGNPHGGASVHSGHPCHPGGVTAAEDQGVVAVVSATGRCHGSGVRAEGEQGVERELRERDRDRQADGRELLARHRDRQRQGKRQSEADAEKTRCGASTGDV